MLSKASVGLRTPDTKTRLRRLGRSRPARRPCSMFLPIPHTLSIAPPPPNRSPPFRPLHNNTRKTRSPLPSSPTVSPKTSEAGSTRVLSPTRDDNIQTPASVSLLLDWIVRNSRLSILGMRFQPLISRYGQHLPERPNHCRKSLATLQINMRARPKERGEREGGPEFTQWTALSPTTEGSLTHPPIQSEPTPLGLPYRRGHQKRRQARLLSPTPSQPVRSSLSSAMTDPLAARAQTTDGEPLL